MSATQRSTRGDLPQLWKGNARVERGQTALSRQCLPIPSLSPAESGTGLLLVRLGRTAGSRTCAAQADGWYVLAVTLQPTTAGHGDASVRRKMKTATPRNNKA